MARPGRKRISIHAACHFSTEMGVLPGPGHGVLPFHHPSWRSQTNYVTPTNALTLSFHKLLWPGQEYWSRSVHSGSIT
jgi:hypothetical protein